MKIIVNAIDYKGSFVDGPGVRAVLFLQGCNFHCKGCHNPQTWDITKGSEFEVHELAVVLRRKCFNKKLTISGGEPLMQKEALLQLLKELKDFDLCLYTGHNFNEIPPEILQYLRYVKVGQFVENLRTTMKPFVGSSNQEFIEVKHHEMSK